MLSRTVCFFRKKYLKSILVFLLCLIPFLSHAELLSPQLYRVQKNQTLSGITFKTLGGPIYGPRGNLRRVLDINQQIKDPDYILPGYLINIPAKKVMEKLAQESILIRKYSNNDTSPVRRETSNTLNDETEINKNTEGLEPVFEKTTDPLSNTTTAPTTAPEENPPQELTTSNTIETPEPIVEKSVVEKNNRNSTTIKTKTTKRSPIRSNWKASLGLSYERIDAIDAVTGIDATLLSDLSPNLAVNWEYYLQKYWSFGISGQLMMEKFMDNVADNNRHIDNPNVNLVSGSFEVSHHEIDRDKTRFALGLQERIFQQTNSNSDIILDKALIPFARFEHRFNLWNLTKGDMGAGGSFTYLFSGTEASYKVESGYGISAFADWNFRRTSNSAMNGRVYYSLHQQNSEIVEQKNSMIGMMFTYMGAL